MRFPPPSGLTVYLTLCLFISTRGKSRSQDTFRLHEKIPLSGFIGEKDCVVPVKRKKILCRVEYLKKKVKKEDKKYQKGGTMRDWDKLHEVLKF